MSAKMKHSSQFLCIAFLWSILVLPVDHVLGADLPPIFSNGIKPVFEHLTVDEGLPDNTVRAVLQDRWGFLWVGTQNGLVRYDGNDMQIFLPTLGDSTAFGGRTVEALFEDSEGYLWIGTFLNGLWRYDPYTERFTSFSMATGTRQDEGKGRITGICEDQEGRIWVSTSQGLASLERDTGKVRWQDLGSPGNSQPTRKYYTTVFADRKGQIWAGTADQGLVVIDLKNGSTRFHSYDPKDPKTLALLYVSGICEDTAGSIWISGNGGLFRWDPSNNAFLTFVPDPEGDPTRNELSCLTYDEDNNLFWVGSTAGLYAFDSQTSRFRFFAHDPSRPLSISNGPVLRVICDHSGLVWAGTWLTGLNKMDPGSGWIRSHSLGQGDTEDSEGHSVSAIHEDRAGVLWVGTSSVHRGGGQGSLKRREQPDTPFRTLRVGANSGKELPAVLSIHEDEGGILWLGTALGLWRTEGDSVVKVSAGGKAPEALSLSSSLLRAVGSTGDGNIWLGTSHGLYRWHRLSDRIFQYSHDPDKSNSINSNAVSLLHTDEKGRLWIGTDDNGLNLYRPESDDFSSFFEPERGLDTVMNLYELPSGEFWLGTFAGLILFDPENGVEAVYDRRDGLPNDLVVALLPDGEGNLWLSTGKGFARFDPARKNFLGFDVRDGLPSNDVNYAHFRSHDGTLFFGGIHGLVSIHPSLFQNNLTVPRVVLTGINVQGVALSVGPESLLAQPPHLTESLTLGHDNNDLSFTFAVLDFGRAEDNNYHFRLENYDERWRTPHEGRTATYTNLDPGQYVFQVQGSNRNGVWSEGGVSLALTILPPWWETGWAYALYALALLGLAWVIYRQIVSRERMNASIAVERAETKHYQDLNSMRSRFLANITHEFRTPLTLIKAPLQLLQTEEITDPGELYATMDRNAGRLGQLIDQLLDLSRLEAGRLPVKWKREDWFDFLRVYVVSFRSLGEIRNIELVTDIPKESCEAWCDRDLLDKLAGNLVSNALKNTPRGGRIIVSVRAGAETVERPVPIAVFRETEIRTALARDLEITVENTGSFIPPEDIERIFDRFHQINKHGGVGIGLALVKEITEWLGGNIRVVSDEVDGTRFTISVPIFVSAPVELFETEADEFVSDEPVSAEPTASGKEGVADEAPQAAPLVLLAEDEPDLRTFLRNGLASEYRVLEVADGRAGLKQALAEIPDLVISDVMMPEMDGFELCRRLKEDERTSHVPIILLTARTEPEDRHHGLRLGADDYLPKPFDVEDLKLRIHNLIDQRRKLAERYSRGITLLEPEAMQVSSADESFLQRAREIIDNHLDDSDFTVEDFCHELAISRTQLHRKLKALLNQSSTEFIRTHRLQRAAQLLEGGYGNVTEVGFAIGFQSLSYFSKTFRDLYGVLPSDYPPKK